MLPRELIGELQAVIEWCSASQSNKYSHHDVTWNEAARRGNADAQLAKRIVDFSQILEEVVGVRLDVLDLNAPVLQQVQYSEITHNGWAKVMNSSQSDRSGMPLRGHSLAQFKDVVHRRLTELLHIRMLSLIPQGPLGVQVNSAWENTR